MVEILTNVGYISMDKFQQLLSTIVSRPQTFSTTVTHAMTDVSSGKAFSIPNFPTSCIIKEIRVRSNFISGQQNWRVSFVNNANGIVPTDTSIQCLTAEIFDVGDSVYIEDEMAYVSAVDKPTPTAGTNHGYSIISNNIIESGKIVYGLYESQIYLKEKNLLFLIIQS